jgi:hypothetical protein
MVYDETKDTVNGSSVCKEDKGSDCEVEIPWMMKLKSDSDW